MAPPNAVTVPATAAQGLIPPAPGPSRHLAPQPADPFHPHHLHPRHASALDGTWAMPDLTVDHRG